MPRHAPDGTVTGRIARWRDVDDEVNAREALRRAEERFRLLAESATDIIVAEDPRGVMTWVSPALTRHLDWSAEDWVGHRPEDFIHPDDAGQLGERRRALEEGRPTVARLRMRDRSGTFHWLESRAAPIVDRTGDPAGFMAALTVIDEQVAREEATHRQATHDHLTGLLNRKEADRLLASILRHDSRAGSATYVAFVDADNLKAVNDELGHAAGDELLVLVAQRMSETLRDEDVVARVGGDEYMLVLPGLQDDDSAHALLTGLLGHVNDSHSLQSGDVLWPRLSIGVTEAVPGDDVQAVVRRADSAMYEAKSRGGNRVQLARSA